MQHGPQLWWFLCVVKNGTWEVPTSANLSFESNFFIKLMRLKMKKPIKFSLSLIYRQWFIKHSSILVSCYGKTPHAFLIKSSPCEWAGTQCVIVENTDSGPLQEWEQFRIQWYPTAKNTELKKKAFSTRLWGKQ